MKYNYEVGGKVQISGKWYEILNVDPNDRWMPVRVRLEVASWWVWEEIIQDYHAPTPPPFEWLPPHYNIDRCRNNLDRRESINAWLTETYGDPTIRTYKGEHPKQFGLTFDSWVMRCAGGKYWLFCHYDNLNLGDQWRKQPHAPQ
jgi:hypothetical protein